ncbi:glutamine-hydrolyzing carbamoyl-phosphate synthase small subunit [Candidatus Ishikawella capsulata]|uniref:glutamine-hydrolyzing carbamoyl-phosphate synthase small subunit n=1 Tax=Candidatus Ishikawella capsulata TaxID=168169 RepID=UPI000596EF18|nr:glutamine-hydrolyzing carbamoyl-phosphate synthase small subunit [Candidatus Ishikawaella capsulata]
MIKEALLVLEDGSQFSGRSVGITGLVVGEVVFNTSITGYQEIITDPSYYRQIVTLTYPHIGNVGINSLDEESTKIYAQGLVIRDLSLIGSNFRSEEDFDHYLQRNHTVAITDIDTRQLTRLLRQKGIQKGCIIAGDNPDAKLAIKETRNFLGLKGMDLAKEVCTSQPYKWRKSSWRLHSNSLEKRKKEELPYNVVAYDYGIKRNILCMLVDRGCSLTVVPAQTSASEVLKMNPDGIFLSNGPGDPESCHYAIKAIKTFLKTDIPIFGICLGHQLLALASGAKTIKMKVGHHGSNHPVKDCYTNNIMITSQNHNFAVDASSIPRNLRVTHISLFDHTIQGLHRTDKPAFSFQGHPEASPGPHDAASLFDYFIELIVIYRSKLAFSVGA